MGWGESQFNPHCWVEARAPAKHPTMRTKIVQPKRQSRPGRDCLEQACLRLSHFPTGWLPGKGKSNRLSRNFLSFCSELACVQKLWLFFFFFKANKQISLFLKWKIPPTTFACLSQPLSCAASKFSTSFPFCTLMCAEVD